ncbi:MAG TPA: hypothetical protein VFQ38_13525 [Longimicrobiales bacterium]|nr:hypothetical protein [Longimicrobiales bacterium]
MVTPAARTPRTLFVYKVSGMDTAEIRGRQIARELGCDTMRLRELTPETAARYDVVVYVKRPAERRVLEEIRRRGVRQVLDPLDNYGWREIGRAARHLDAFIGANLTHAVHLRRRFGLPAAEIPHHHCNFDELRIPRRTPPTLGFISTPDHWPMNRRLAERTGYPAVSNVSRKGERGFERLVEAYLSVDVGFVYRMRPEKMRFNCANKLTNYMSFGIPSVLTPESGFLEYGRHGETVLYAHTKEDFVDLLRWLAADTDLRMRMSDACYDAARPFHISRIAERYREFLASL